MDMDMIMDMDINHGMGMDKYHECRNTYKSLVQHRQFSVSLQTYSSTVVSPVPLVTDQSASAHLCQLGTFGEITLDKKSPATVPLTR